MEQQKIEIPQESSSIMKTIKTIRESASDTTSKVITNAKNMIDNQLSDASVIIGLVIVILLCILIAWGLYVIISGSVFNQSKLVIQETKVPILCNEPSTFPITKFNSTGNGFRRTYTFWIYIHDLNKYTGTYKHVWHIGDATNDIRNASPYVFLDKTENKLYVRFASLSSDSFPYQIAQVQGLTDENLNQFMQQGITIDYIPIQRWVHVAIVINENSNGGSIVAYVDGDISKILTTGQPLSNGSIVRVSNLNLDKQGNLYTGGSIGSIYGTGFSGLISKVTLFNYDLNDKDIYKDYNEGPLNGFLASLGIGNYGVRSPIYKIS